MADIYIQFAATGPLVGAGVQAGINFNAVYPAELGCTGFGGITDPTTTGTLTDIIARPTTRGRQMIARTIVEGLSWKITEMALGSWGYDPSDPTRALVIDPDALTLGNELFRKPIDLVEIPTVALTSRAFVGRFDRSSFVGGVGEVGLIAEILDSPLDPGEVGDKFLFAVAHQGLNTKTAHHVTTYRIFVSI